MQKLSVFGLNKLQKNSQKLLQARVFVLTRKKSPNIIIFLNFSAKTQTFFPFVSTIFFLAMQKKL